MTKISVIMPVYNKAKYIHKSIKSVLTQTFTDFELIIIDDGSFDGTSNICDKFAQDDNRVKVYHIKNSGVSNARNIGIEESTGKYLYFIDADDYIDDNFIEEIVEIIENNNVDLVLIGFKKINHTGAVLTEVLPTLRGIKTKVEFLQGFAYEQKETGIYGYAWNKIVKADIIKNNGTKFDTNIKLAEDYLFWINVYKVIDKIYFLNKSYYNYLQDAENSSSGIDIQVDYFNQIMIVVQAKQLLKSYDVYNEKNKKWIEYKISNYIYCFAFHQNLNKYQNYKTQIQKVINDKNIMESISLFKKTSLQKIILSFVIMRCVLGLFIFLKARDIVRKKYRDFKGEFHLQKKIQ